MCELNWFSFCLESRERDGSSSGGVVTQTSLACQVVEPLS